MPPRDNQRERVYRAEREVFHYWERDTATLGELREAQQYANRVTSSKVWRTVGGPPFVLVKDGRSRRKAAMVGPTTIAVPKWARSEPMILHELAHILSLHIDRSIAGHGPEYVLLFRMLVESHLGADKRRELDHAFEKNHVRWGTEGKRFAVRMERLQSWS